MSQKFSPIKPSDVKYVTCIGAGPIGAGWAAYFLAHGYHVTSYIHDLKEEKLLRALIENAWISLEALGLSEGASLENFSCTNDLAKAVAKAEFIQESIPENLGLKQALYTKLGELVAANVVIASSTSGLSMTDIQAQCSTPHRTVVGHPFNPPYLLPLVEMVKGEKTLPEAVDWLVEFYKSAGKAPLVLSKDIPGFIATRLQEAIWREALHMVDNNEATVEEIDFAITNGPGPRWALMGPCLTFHNGGGEGGMAYNLDQFGPTLKIPWTRLVAPELTQELRDKMVDGCIREAGEHDYISLSRARDAGLVAIQKALKGMTLPLS
ncbi:3-hydroxyacyl-CoA dehydrogenase NAD-binding domain-containing protein [Dasania marina]|uniref:3-hydroxyacyl-CoA dehydrogenase NAD-binding domain-containing protein n=1 Tax=Dasania marina TaxID=471499 RepID=UPI000371194F|nr:3-hydroxyacyl-CoA dehydrogenase NAD-binding domain-containing protein [Dasania marina]